MVEDWQAYLPPEAYKRLFPRGKIDEDAFRERQRERQAHGWPATCDDPVVLMEIARIVVGG